MATNYPGSIDSYTIPSGSATLGGSTPTHTAQHQNESDAIVALQTFVGTSSTPGLVSARDRADKAWLPTGVKYENYPRLSQQGRQDGVYTSGTLLLCGGAYLDVGATLTTATFYNSGTAASGLTHSWACLVDASLNVLAKSADITSNPFTSFLDVTFTWSTYTILASGPFYVGLLVVATTMPSIGGGGSGLNLTLAPSLAANSTTGLTTPATLGGTAATRTAPTQGVLPYVRLG